MSSVTQESCGGKACPICREIHEPGRGLSFDGCGINSCGAYRSRIAKLEPEYLSVGPMLAAAPDLYAALKEVAEFLKAYHDAGELNVRIRAALEKAVSQ